MERSILFDSQVWVLFVLMATWGQNNSINVALKSAPPDNCSVWAEDGCAFVLLKVWNHFQSCLPSRDAQTSTGTRVHVIYGWSLTSSGTRLVCWAAEQLFSISEVTHQVQHLMQALVWTVTDQISVIDPVESDDFSWQTDRWRDVHSQSSRNNRPTEVW